MLVTCICSTWGPCGLSLCRSSIHRRLTRLSRCLPTVSGSHRLVCLLTSSPPPLVRPGTTTHSLHHPHTSLQRPARTTPDKTLAANFSLTLRTRYQVTSQRHSIDRLQVLPAVQSLKYSTPVVAPFMRIRVSIPCSPQATIPSRRDSNVLRRRRRADCIPALRVGTERGPALGSRAWGWESKRGSD